MVMAPAFIGGVGGQEILFALAIALILFGPKRLPEFARKIAKVSHKLREANRQIKRELYSNLDPEEIMRERPTAPPPPRPMPAARNVEQGAEEAAGDPLPEGEQAETVEESRDASQAPESSAEPIEPIEPSESAEPEQAPSTSREVLDDLDAGVDYDAPYRDAEAAAAEADSEATKKTDPGQPGSVE
jgi:Sec-independent protein translocase protein TatA